MIWRKDDQRDPHDGDYMGNIFGWRISMIGLAVIVLLGGLVVYRHYSLGIPFGMADPEQTTIDVVPVDTLLGTPAYDSLNRE